MLFDFFEPELKKASPLSSLHQSTFKFMYAETDFSVLFFEGPGSVHLPSPSSDKNESLNDEDTSTAGLVSEVRNGIHLNVSDLRY